MLHCLKTLSQNWTPQKTRWLLGGLGAALILALVVLSWAGWLGWGWARGFWCWLKGSESGSATVRNLVLTIGGPFALWLAWQRSVVAQRGLMNERYQKSAEMLGNNVLAVRLGGIYALQRLAEEDPKQYHVQVMRLFCAFARNPVEYEWSEEYQSGRSILREDVQAVMDAIATRSNDDIALEKRVDFRLKLRAAKLSGGVFRDGNLSGADLISVNLSGSVLTGANLAHAALFETIGLTQAQLDQARADPENPPMLEGVLDTETGEQLVWDDV